MFKAVQNVSSVYKNVQNVSPVFKTVQNLSSLSCIYLWNKFYSAIYGYERNWIRVTVYTSG